MNEWYILTDGMTDEPYDERFMSADEARQANEHADIATDGTFWWALKYPPSEPGRTYLCKCHHV